MLLQGKSEHTWWNRAENKDSSTSSTLELAPIGTACAGQNCSRAEAWYKLLLVVLLPSIQMARTGRFCSMIIHWSLRPKPPWYHTGTVFQSPCIREIRPTIQQWCFPLIFSRTVFPYTYKTGISFLWCCPCTSFHNLCPLHPIRTTDFCFQTKAPHFQK